MRINFCARRKKYFRAYHFRAGRVRFKFFGILKIQLNIIFQDFGLFHDFLERLCSNLVIIFAHLSTAYNFGIHISRIFWSLRKIARKLVPLIRYIPYQIYSAKIHLIIHCISQRSEYSHSDFVF